MIDRPNAADSSKILMSISVNVRERVALMILKTLKSLIILKAFIQSIGLVDIPLP